MSWPIFEFPIFGMFFLTSCCSGKTIVHEPMVIQVQLVKNQVQIFRNNDTVNISEHIKSTFEKKLSQRLYGDNLIQNALGIQLTYRFVHFDEGNRFMRYAFKGIGNVGEASLMIEVTYMGPNGVKLGRIYTEGKISNGVYGGSSDEAVEKAAMEVANYTRNLILN
jgi:hypothetical protein